jgi:hypothetical protein
VRRPNIKLKGGRQSENQIVSGFRIIVVVVVMSYAMVFPDDFQSKYASFASSYIPYSCSTSRTFDV